MSTIDPASSSASQLKSELQRAETARRERIQADGQAVDEAPGAISRETTRSVMAPDEASFERIELDAAIDRIDTDGQVGLSAAELDHLMVTLRQQGDPAQNLVYAQGELARAEERVAEFEQRRGAALAQAAPFIEPAQFEALQASFNDDPEYKAALEARETARSDMQALLSEHRDYFADLVVNRPVSFENGPAGHLSGSEITESFLQMAETDPELLEGFLDKVTDPATAQSDAAADRALSLMVDQGDRIAQALYQAELSESGLPDQAFARVESFYERAVNRFTNNPRSLRGDVNNLAQMHEVIRHTRAAFQTRDPAVTLAALTRTKSEINATGRFGSALVGLGFATAPLRFGSAVESGDYRQLAEFCLSTIDNAAGLKSLEGAMGVLMRSPGARRVLGTAIKAGMLGAVADASGAYRAFESGNFVAGGGGVAAAAAPFAGLLGFPGVGHALAVAGVAGTLGGMVYQGYLDRADARARLEDVGVDPALADRIVGLEAEEAQAVGQTGMSDRELPGPVRDWAMENAEVIERYQALAGDRQLDLAGLVTALDQRARACGDDPQAAVMAGLEQIRNAVDDAEGGWMPWRARGETPAERLGNRARGRGADEVFVLQRMAEMLGGP